MARRSRPSVWVPIDTRARVPDPLPKIDQAPTHDAVGRGDGATLDSSRQLVCMKARATPGSLAIDQAIGAARIEPQRPVPHCLQTYPIGARRFASAAAVINHRQQPTNLPKIAPRLRKPP
jgi:hypothetical protein